MADIELVIKIPSVVYEQICKKKAWGEYLDGNESVIASGIPIPKGHGDLIDRNLALSDDGLCEFHMYNDYVKMRNYLKSIPTIIEADKAESEVQE